MGIYVGVEPLERLTSKKFNNKNEVFPKPKAERINEIKIPKMKNPIKLASIRFTFFLVANLNSNTTKWWFFGGNFYSNGKKKYPVFLYAKN